MTLQKESRRTNVIELVHRRAAILVFATVMLAACTSGAIAQDHCGAFHEQYSYVSPEAARQQLLGKTCADQEIAKAQRTIACEKLAEDVEHDGAEFRAADDQLLILLEK